MLLPIALLILSFLDVLTLAGICEIEPVDEKLEIQRHVYALSLNAMS